MSRSTTVGIIQFAPAYMDLAESTRRAVGHIEEAAGQGVNVVVFGETWLAGYPAWLDHCRDAALWDHEATKQVYARLRRSSPVVPGPETSLIAAAAKKHAVTVVIGVNERVEQGPGNGTLYNSLLTFGPDGTLLNHHRKLVPTFTERLVWGNGDADGLKAADTATGRIGGLICWEHWMPLARQAMHDSGEDIHVAVFPTVHEMHQIASRHYAFEGRCFVIAAGLIMKLSDLPEELEKPLRLAGDPNPYLLRGGSSVIAPDGQYVVEPVYDEETILIAKIDLDEGDKEKMTLDVSGHYQRPDIFDLRVVGQSRR